MVHQRDLVSRDPVTRRIPRVPLGRQDSRNPLSHFIIQLLMTLGTTPALVRGDGTTMELLINLANVLYLLSYFVQDMLRLRLLTVVAATCLSAYFYFLPEPLMVAVYWNLGFIGLNLFRIARLKGSVDRVPTVVDRKASVPSVGAVLAEGLSHPGSPSPPVILCQPSGPHFSYFCALLGVPDAVLSD